MRILELGKLPGLDSRKYRGLQNARGGFVICWREAGEVKMEPERSTYR